MNADGTDFLANGAGGFELLDEIENIAGQSDFQQPTAQFGISSPTPGIYQQSVQQGLTPGAPMQSQVGSALPAGNGTAGYQHHGRLSGDADLGPGMDDIRQFLIENPEIYPVSSPLPQNISNDPESPYIGQWTRVEQLMQGGSELEKSEIGRIWIEASDSLFNITLRREFASFIERMRWDQIDPADNEQWGQNFRLADTLKLELYNEVATRLQTFHGNPDVHFQLQRWANSLADPVASPLNVVQPIKTVLDREKAIIDLRNQQGVQSVNSIGQDMQNLALQPDHQLARISATSTELLDLERVSQEACMQVQELVTQVQQLQVPLQGQLRFIDVIERGGLSQAELQGLTGLVRKRDMVVQKEKAVLEKFWSSLEELRKLLSKVLDNGIKEYQRNAAYIECGKLTSHYLTLDQLQDWVKRLAKLVSSNLQQMEKLMFLEQQLGLDSQPQPPNGATSLQYIQELIRNYSSMIELIVQKGLVVEKHPPQVLMKDKRFQSQLRHLVGDALDIHKISFRVRVFLINGEQAVRVLQEGPTSTSFSKSGEIINDRAGSDYIAQTGLLSVTMRTMCLKMQQRGSQRTAEMVAELKFAMLYRTEITVRYLSHQTTVAAQALSLPIVVISHGKQEADAQATIFWDNAFAHINRHPFEVDDSVPWTEMLDALDARWKIACKEGTQNVVGLTPQARQYLTAKLFNQKEVPSGAMISWRKFNHDKMVMCGGADQRKDHLFTFWTWFYKAMELCSCKYIRRYWNLGYIHGFLSKQDCQEMLLRAARGRQAGIFMFRFSETQLAAVSISCTVNKDDRIQVHNLSPDTAAEFKVRSLPDMVQDLKYLQYLYPDQPKDQVFGSYYERKIVPLPAGHDGYIQKQFVVSTATDMVNRAKKEPGAGPESPLPGYPVSSPAMGFPRDDGSMDEDSN